MRRNNPDVSHLEKVYKDMHWGAPATLRIKINDPLVPHVVAEGRLRELEIPSGLITFPDPGSDAKESWLVFEPGGLTRLHIILAPHRREEVRQAMKGAGRTEYLQAIAERAGGRQARKPLPDVKAVALGELLSFVYHTEKIPDGPSDYHHECGEESGIRPILAADVSGRLWACGGNYRVTEAGVCD